MAETIGSIIRTVVSEATGEYQAQDIVARVLERITPDQYLTYIEELLLSRVSSETARMRNTTSPARSSLSTKQRLIRDEYWPKFLEQKIALPSGYKALADATYDDLIFVAQMRRSQANDLLGKAQQFESLAELMRSTGAKTLGRLDPEVGKRTLAA